MKLKRLTREQRKEQTRERLLNAARDIFSTKGFIAASVEDIAATAGYTRGAFYSNFEGKTDLLLELLQRDHDKVEADAQWIFDRCTTREDMMAASLDCFRLLNDQPESYLLWIEAKLHSARDDRFRAKFCSLFRKQQEHMAGCISTIAECTGAQLPLPAEMLALGLVALREGMQSRRAADSCNLPDERFDVVLTRFLAFILSGSGARPTDGAS
ncbi:TetR/AcrR family transcriptional regulator [Paraburkholderia sp. LEh10]|nr:TetR/AcrR family transcriptional regulator [Paraburkholderia sp. LEh10]